MRQKENSSDDEIIRDWTLTNSDKALLLKLNKSYRSYVAVQLCSMRLYGRFLNQLSDLSVKIINYINNQLNLAPALFIDKPSRKATYLEHRKIIFKHLGFANFDDNARNLLEGWVAKKDYFSLLPEELYPQAEHYLISNKIALPSSNQLKRLINTLMANYHNEVFKKINQQSNNDLDSSINQILNIGKDQSVTWFQRFKEYPPTASITSLKYYLEKYQKLLDIPLDTIDLSQFHSNFIDYLYKLGKYYSADAIKRFKADKKHAIVIAFLAESKKVILDYLVQMHDQYICDICRQCNNIHDSQLKQYRNKYERALNSVTTVIDHLLICSTEKPIDLNNIFQNTISKTRLTQAREG